MAIPKNIIPPSAFIMLLAFIFCIPFNWTASNICIWIFLGLCVLNIQSYQKDQYQNIGKAGLIFAGASAIYILWILISMIWTDDTATGIKLTIRVLPIAALPIAVVCGKACGYIRDTRWLLIAFVAGTIAAYISNLYLSYQDCWYEVNGERVFFNNAYREDITLWEGISRGISHFSYTNLSHFGHPSYSSIYGLFSIAVLYHQMRSGNGNIAAQCLMAMLLSFCLVMVYLFNSRANLISLMLLIPCILAYEIAVKKNHILPLAILTMGITGGIFMLNSGRGESIKERFNSIKNNGHNYKGIDTRLDIWIEASQVIKKHPIWGTGIGDGDNALMGQYLIDGCNEYYEREYVTHNQFMDAQMSRGIMGSITLWTLFLIPLIEAIRRRDFVLLALTTITFINCIFENMLNRSGGFMFYPLMMAILLVGGGEENKLRQ